MNLIVHSLAHPVTSLGPGRRVVLWVTGCAKHCEGCMSPEMQDPEAGKAIPVPRYCADCSSSSRASTA